MRTYFVSVPGFMSEISFCEAAGQINVPLAVCARPGVRVRVVCCLLVWCVS